MKFKGPYVFELYDFELNKINENYPSYAGVYAFVTKGERIYIDTDKMGSDILKFGSTNIPLACRMLEYYNLNRKKSPKGNTITAWKVRHFRYFHCDKGLKVYFKKSDNPKKEEEQFGEYYHKGYYEKPLLEMVFKKYKTWSKGKGTVEESFEEPIGGSKWDQEKYEKKYGLKPLPKKLKDDSNED